MVPKQKGSSELPPEGRKRRRGYAPIGTCLLLFLYYTSSVTVSGLRSHLADVDVDVDSGLCADTGIEANDCIKIYLGTIFFLNSFLSQYVGIAWDTSSPAALSILVLLMPPNIQIWFANNNEVLKTGCFIEMLHGYLWSVSLSFQMNEEVDLFIILLNSAEEVDTADSFCFEPVDLNRFFGDDGRIYGYKDLKWLGIKDRYLDPLLKVLAVDDGKEGAKGITDLNPCLRKILGESMIETKDEFLQTFSTDKYYIG
ncbi:hypothetical protein ACLOJK_040089 [Asimina triloba]